MSATSLTFHSCRVTLKKGEPPLLAIATVKVAEAVFVTGLRVIEGKAGLFVSMPHRKEKGEYFDICFPASKPMRDELSAVVLAAYHEAVTQAIVAEG